MRKPNYRKLKHEADNEFYRGNSIEEEMRIAETTQQPIENASPIIFTPRSEGVIAAYDIRTDRFEIAQDAMDKVARSYQARRAERNDQPKTEPTGTEGKE